MSRPVSLFLLGLLFVISSAMPVAASNPQITGIIEGIELCAQSSTFPWCSGKAVFAGTFKGDVGNKPAVGLWVVALNHAVPLNQGDLQETAILPGGEWQIVTREGKKEISGTVQGGTLTYHELGNFFDVMVMLEVNKGGNGPIVVVARLFHDPFPPEIIGTLNQPSG
jgi:hypothetical protein